MAQRAARRKQHQNDGGGQNHRGAEIGFQQNQAAGYADQKQRQQHGPERARADGRAGQHPRQQQHQRHLGELRRLHRHAEHHQPAVGAINSFAEEQHQHQQRQRRQINPPRVAQPEFVIAEGQRGGHARAQRHPPNLLDEPRADDANVVAAPRGAVNKRQPRRKQAGGEQDRQPILRHKKLPAVARALFHAGSSAGGSSSAGALGSGVGRSGAAGSGRFMCSTSLNTCVSSCFTRGAAVVPPLMPSSTSSASA
ncbi:MAG: hypothetical protein BWX54_01682 [Verrucomicrobia bacterium ADurb.Bin018]|nr:MAG: hypothetical protein BWX54_01682 [Verrucomicrobia bacterium ADurb.Bin018]